MITYLLALLTALEEALPPGGNRHHGFTRQQFGSDENGWEWRFTLSLWIYNGPPPNAWSDPSLYVHNVWLDDADLEKPVPILVAEILDALAQFTRDRAWAART